MPEKRALHAGKLSVSRIALRLYSLLRHDPIPSGLRTPTLLQI